MLSCEPTRHFGGTFLAGFAFKDQSDRRQVTSAVGAQKVSALRKVGMSCSFATPQAGWRKCDATHAIRPRLAAGRSQVRIRTEESQRHHPLQLRDRLALASVSGLIDGRQQRRVAGHTPLPGWQQPSATAIRSRSTMRAPKRAIRRWHCEPQYATTSSLLCDPSVVVRLQVGSSKSGCS